MLVAHATWHGGALCLWAERTGPYEPSPDVHPFATCDFTGTSYEPLLRAAFRVELAMSLPTAGDHPLPSAELGPEPVRDEPELRTWRVPALVLAPFPAMALLQAAEHSADVIAGTDLRFLCMLADEAVHLAGRGHVLPALLREDGDLVARWRPVIDDPARFRALARAMPAACRAAGGGRPAAEVLREALSALVDTAVRGVVPHPLLVSRRKEPDRLPLAERWVMALTGPSPEVAREPRDDPDDLIAELDAWAAAARRPSGPLRVCFRLAEPGAEEFEEDAEPRDGDSWRVEFALQGTDDPSLYVPAALVWEGEATSIPQAEETLLAGLGRALRLFPDLAPALDGPAPGELLLDTAGAFRFLRQAAPMLAAAGFGVLLPQWAGKAKLGMKLTARNEDPEASAGAAAPSGFDLKSMVDFRWDLAIGDASVDEAELEELARLKTPLVRLRGQWVELDEHQLEAALDFLRHPRRGRMTAAEAIRAIVHAGDDALPLTEVDATGPLGDLLSGEADRRLTPLRTPDGFNGTLRPFQERGLAWLKFLGDLGLGGVLADSMGLGKCIGKDEFVFVNGALMKAKDVWARYASALEPDGEGEWTTPAQELTVNSIAKDGRIVPAVVTHLYRQHINEKVRKVRLDDGSEIIVTRRHRLLGLDDWTTDLRPGTRVCVPARLRHEGGALDPDLTVLLAWQIAEGSEGRWTTVVITQKNVRTLEDLQARLKRVAGRFDLAMDDAKLVSGTGTKVPFLRFSGKPYRELLEEHGYRWGGHSAHKRIPETVMAADESTVRLFLRHFFAAESSVDTSRRLVEISSASVWIMRQLSTLLRRFGVRLRISTAWKCATNGTGVKRPYQIGLIGGASLRRFHRLIGIADAAKQVRMDEICARSSNTNVEGVPGSDLLRRAQEVTELPMRHLSINTAYFYGTQEFSRGSAREAVGRLDHILSGEAEAEYRRRRGCKWTAQTLAAYERLDGLELQRIRDRLDERATREVYYARIASVEELDYEGFVYDFEVADHHNYVAEGMLCHNTAQSLALLASERADGERPGPTLLIGPMSLVGNWQREAARFTPKLRVYVHHGTGRRRGEGLAAAVAGADLVLTTYGTAARDAEMLAAIDWERVICDEAQALKNSGTRQARAVRSIPARSRIALTGTPVENHLTELWSIMEFANPGLLGPRSAFRQRFAIPIEREGDEQAALALRRATQPFILRRLKTDKSIISDLPEKQEIKVYCNLTTEQASLYQATVDDMLQQIAEAEEAERRGLVLATMAKLKQVCNHPAHLLKDGSRLPGRSGKLERLEEICAEVLEQGEKALVFTQYAEFGSMLQPYLAARLERPVLWLHGGTSKQGRDDLVQRFQEDTEPAIFLLSLKAAGTGLTLTAANHVVHVDRWWNPAVEDQATDRAFRIGQTRNVQVRKFVCVGTMEERVDEMIERKKALADSIVGTGEDWLTELSVAELRDVLRLSPEAVSD
jgi:SNF2 family DNA or RNA helicase